MMFYLSLADNHTGKWLGAMFVNAPTEQEAGARAAAIEGATECIQIISAPVRAGAPPIPAGFYGRLLNQADLEQLGTPVAHFSADDEGNLQREA